MTDLREDIAERRCINCEKPDDACLMKAYICQAALQEADQILTLIDTHFEELAKERGWVKLAEDQRNPLEPHSDYDDEKLHKAGFRRVKL